MRCCWLVSIHTFAHSHIVTFVLYACMQVLVSCDLLLSVPEFSIIFLLPSTLNTHKHTVDIAISFVFCCLVTGSKLLLHHSQIDKWTFAICHSLSCIAQIHKRILSLASHLPFENDQKANLLFFNKKYYSQNDLAMSEI